MSGVTNIVKEKMKSVSRSLSGEFFHVLGENSLIRYINITTTTSITSIIYYNFLQFIDGIGKMAVIEPDKTYSLFFCFGKFIWSYTVQSVAWNSLFFGWFIICLSPLYICLCLRAFACSWILKCFIFMVFMFLLLSKSFCDTCCSRLGQGPFDWEHAHCPY